MVFFLIRLLREYMNFHYFLLSYFIVLMERADLCQFHSVINFIEIILKNLILYKNSIAVQP